MSQQTLSPKAAWAVGLLVAAMGLLVILLVGGVIGGNPSAPDATPRWVGVCAGLVFVLGGAALINGYALVGGTRPDGDLPPGAPWALRVTQSLLGLGMIGSLAAIASWVAFGSAPRTFTGTASGLGHGRIGEGFGRALFGLGAVLLYIFLAVFVVVSVRRLRAGKE